MWYFDGPSMLLIFIRHYRIVIKTPSFWREPLMEYWRSWASSRECLTEMGLTYESSAGYLWNSISGIMYHLSASPPSPLPSYRQRTNGTLTCGNNFNKGSFPRVMFLCALGVDSKQEGMSLLIWIKTCFSVFFYKQNPVVNCRCFSSDRPRRPGDEVELFWLWKHKRVDISLVSRVRTKWNYS